MNGYPEWTAIPEWWRLFISKVSLAGLTPKIEFSYADSPWGPLVIVTREVLDAKTGEPTKISVAYPPSGLGVDPLRYLRDLAAGNLGHEVNEFFTYDGTRPFYPHAVPR